MYMEREEYEMTSIFSTEESCTLRPLGKHYKMADTR